MKTNGEITSGTAPAYFCGIATVVFLSVFFPHRDPCKTQDERDHRRETGKMLYTMP